MTARCLGKFYFTDGDNLERSYKHSLSNFPEWDQLEHASDWILIEENIGERLSIDETSLRDGQAGSLAPVQLILHDVPHLLPDALVVLFYQQAHLDTKRSNSFLL